MVEFKGQNIIIMCCSKCNVKCSHCYIEYNGNLTCSELEDMIIKLKDRYNITLNGSELLLNKGYLKLLKLINQDRVTTNGLIIHNNLDLINEMKENGIKTVGMSYHFGLHDIVSPINKQVIIDNIKMLKEHGFNVEIMTTVSTVNYQNIEEMVKEAIRLNANCIRFTNLFNEGRTLNLDNKLLLSDEQINEFFDQFYHCKEKYKDLITVRRSGTFSRDFRKKDSSYYCPSTEKTIAISPDKKVYPCPFLIKDGFEIGYYEDGKIFLEQEYDLDSSRCMLHDVLNRGKVYEKRRLH